MLKTKLRWSRIQHPALKTIFFWVLQHRLTQSNCLQWGSLDHYFEIICLFSDFLVQKLVLKCDVCFTVKLASSGNKCYLYPFLYYHQTIMLPKKLVVRI